MYISSLWYRHSLQVLFCAPVEKEPVIKISVAYLMLIAIWVHKAESFCRSEKILKPIPLQARTGPEGSRRLRLPGFKLIAT